MRVRYFRKASLTTKRSHNARGRTGCTFYKHRAAILAIIALFSSSDNRVGVDLFSTYLFFRYSTKPENRKLFARFFHEVAADVVCRHLMKKNLARRAKQQLHQRERYAIISLA